MARHDDHLALQRQRVLQARLEEQNHRCAYPCGNDGHGGPLAPGDALALAYDGHGLVHLACAQVGTVPTTTTTEDQ